MLLLFCQQGSKYWSRPVRLGWVVFASVKPTTKPIFEFDSEMVWINLKGEVVWNLRRKMRCSLKLEEKGKMFDLEIESVFFGAWKVVLFPSIVDGFIHPIVERQKWVWKRTRGWEGRRNGYLVMWWWVLMLYPMDI